MPTLDFTFVRGGRPPESWLPELVSDDPDQRNAAAEALGGMWAGLPWYSTTWNQIELPTDAPSDLGPQMERFGRAVREAVERPDFPKTSFVRRLLLRHLTRKSERLTAVGLVVSHVFDALDTALLEAEDLLHEMLADRHLRHQTIQALERLGSAASPFVPDLLEQMEEGYRFQGPRVLGAVARVEPAVAEELVHRLRGGSEAVQLAAGASLEEAGPAIGGPLTGPAIGLLRELARKDLGFVKPLASLGRDREDVLEEVLALAVPRPPRITKVYYGQSSSYEQDEVMYERGAAIEGLRFFTRFSERVVPVLADAIETFEEYDPDWVYKGEHLRVTASLRSFGTSAADLAVPRLTQHVWQSDGQVDWDVVRLLGEMGPAAEEALPVLRELDKVLRNLDPQWEPSNPPDPEYDGAAWAIWQICGGP